MRLISLIFIIFVLSACTVGPDYKRPSVDVPMQFKEAPPGWKIAQPKDDVNRGNWWEVFNDPKLNQLETTLNKSNQNIATAAANYSQALDLVDEARAGYFPTVDGVGSVFRQRQGSFGSTGFVTSTSGSTSPGIGTGGSHTAAEFTSYSLLLSATWQPDIWGQVRREVEASASGAQASHALLASTRLSQQALLAQSYFELRALDTDQKLLNVTVADYKESLKLTQFQYKSGVASEADIVQAQSQLQSAQAQAINNGIARAQYEHAIAVLIGKLPEQVSFASMPLKAKPPQIPLIVPSTLLERRPDVAQAERLMAQANAQVGVAISAFYPTFPLTGTSSVSNTALNQLFKLPSLSWAVGQQVSETIFNGGLRIATVKAARAGYDSTVASYRETVLAAFQSVEDNLSSLRILEQEGVVLNQAADSAREALKLTINQYRAGTVPYSSVIVSQTAAYLAEKNAADNVGLQMTSAVGLITALGGGWDVCEVCKSPPSQVWSF